MSSNQPDKLDPVEQAIADRLGHLRTRPVDLSRLKARVEAEIPRRKQNPIVHVLLLRPMRAVAALLAIGVTVLVITLASWSSPAVASTNELLRLHESVVSQTMPMTSVSSAEAVNAALEGKWPDAPAMPNMPDQQMACCVHHMGKAKAACVLLSIDGAPVTLAAADTDEIKMPEGSTVKSQGHDYRVQSADGVSMVMIQRGGKWYCLMGKLPSDRLITYWNGVLK